MEYSISRSDEKNREFLHKLNGLDFGPLAYKLMHPEDRPAMPLEQAIDAIRKYKGFLALYYANQGKQVSPSRYVDYVWHTHILDTELYSAQCGLLFERYLHHFPFFGKRGANDEKELLAAAEATKSQALARFGWDDDDWCGTGNKIHWPGHKSGTAELARILLPDPSYAASESQAGDSLTIEAGNFRHTVEYMGRGSAPVTGLAGSGPSSTLDKLGRQQSQIHSLKLPIWVIVCFPVDLSVLNEVLVFQSRDQLVNIARGLVEKRLTPTGFSNELVNLQFKH
jgi:hypothetical protein